MAINTLNEKFEFGLGALYDAEHQFLEAQQTMLDSANSASVQENLKIHISQTEQQITNLEKVFEILGVTPERQTNYGAKGIVEEGDEALGQTEDVPALADLAIAGSCFKVEHYEIAAYRGMIAYAETIGQSEVVRLLQKNLQQEEETAQNLESGMPTLLRQAMKSASQTA